MVQAGMKAAKAASGFGKKPSVGNSTKPGREPIVKVYAAATFTDELERHDSVSFSWAI
jgi:hypothetical protein